MSLEPSAIKNLQNFRKIGDEKGDDLAKMVLDPLPPWDAKAKFAEAYDNQKTLTQLTKKLHSKTLKRDLKQLHNIQQKLFNKFKYIDESANLSESSIVSMIARHSFELARNNLSLKNLEIASHAQCLAWYAIRNIRQLAEAAIKAGGETDDSASTEFRVAITVDRAIKELKHLQFAQREITKSTRKLKTWEEVSKVYRDQQDLCGMLSNMEWLVATPSTAKVVKTVALVLEMARESFLRNDMKVAIKLQRIGRLVIRTLESRIKAATEADRKSNDSNENEWAKRLMDPTPPENLLATISKLEKQQKRLADATRKLRNWKRELARLHERQQNLCQIVNELECLATAPEVLDILKTANFALKVAGEELQREQIEAANRLQHLGLHAIKAAQREVQEVAKKLDNDISKGQQTKYLIIQQLQKNGYNELLDIADEFLKAPELSLTLSSRIVQDLQKYPDCLAKYFEPIPCPTWVDEAKIKIANRIWQENTLSAMIALYAASLPFCYIIKNAIPLLFQADRLVNKKFIYQRMYETGLMLDNVMQDGGISFVRDPQKYGYRELFETAVRNVKPNMNFRFGWYNQPVFDDGSEKDLESDEVIEEVSRLLAERENRDGYQGKFLWGRGVIQAKKVRALHASMRLYALQPEKFGKIKDDTRQQRHAHAMTKIQKPFDKEKHGVPINQQDMAYTLLTFGYTIPRALTKLGCQLSHDEKEAFLHCWKIIGHIIGIRKELMTDNWEEAEWLFNTIKDDNKGKTTYGVEMTGILCEFLEGYLPSWFSLDKSLPPIIIKHFLGADTDLIFDEPTKQASRNRVALTLWWVMRTIVIRLWFITHHLVIKRSNTAQTLRSEIINGTAKALIKSWKGAFDRKAFYYTEGLNGFIRGKGVGKAFRKRLEKWRRKVFYTIALILFFLLTASVCIPVGVLGCLCGSGLRDFLYFLLLIGTGSLVLSVGFFKIVLKRVLENRPKRIGVQGYAFLVDVADQRRLWMVHDITGLCKMLRPCQSIPFWSSQRRAKRFLNQIPELSNFEPVELTWEEFRQTWLPDLKKRNLLVGLNWGRRADIRSKHFNYKPALVRESIEVEINRPKNDGGTAS